MTRAKTDKEAPHRTGTSFLCVFWASQNYSIIFKTLSSVSIKGIKLKDQDLAPDPAQGPAPDPAHLQIATEEVVGKRYVYLTDLM